MRAEIPIPIAAALLLVALLVCIPLAIIAFARSMRPRPDRMPAAYELYPPAGRDGL